MIVRLVLGAVGVLAGLYGAYLLLEQGGANFVATLTWLVGGVVLHDAVLGALLVLAGLVVARTVPGAVRAPVAAGLVVLGTVTATAVPVLGRFGARPDNATLLDRHYVVGWVVFTVLVVGGVVAGIVGERRRGPVPSTPDVTAEPHDEKEL